MKKYEKLQTITHLFEQAGDSGLTYEDLKSELNIPINELKQLCEQLWQQGTLTGLRTGKCCGRGCRFMCVAYMDVSKKWRLNSMKTAPH